MAARMRSGQGGRIPKEPRNRVLVDTRTQGGHGTAQAAAENDETRTTRQMTSRAPSETPCEEEAEGRKKRKNGQKERVHRPTIDRKRRTSRQQTSPGCACRCRGKEAPRKTEAPFRAFRGGKRPRATSDTTGGGTQARREGKRGEIEERCVVRGRKDGQSGAGSGAETGDWEGTVRRFLKWYSNLKEKKKEREKTREKRPCVVER